MSFFQSILRTSLWASTVIAAPQVMVGNTLITGAISPTSSQVETFKGIPYAEPPLGNLRFQPPVFLPTLNTSTFDASNFGYGCLTLTPENELSEDCLTINVFRPAGYENQSLPVLVFIHGGGLVWGTSAAYDGSILVDRSISRGTPMLWVSFNYRLVQMGFPQGEEAQSRNALNLGLKDQLVALEWVQKNIGAFGGDKDKITVQGHSAGAHSIDIHLHSSKIKSLARAAILESSMHSTYHTPSEGNDQWSAFVAAVPECAHLAGSKHTFQCMQSANTTSLLNAIGAGAPNYQVVIDGKDGVLPDYLSQLKLKSNMPMLIGSQLDDGTIMTPQNVTSTEDIKNFLFQTISPSPRGDATFNASLARLLQLYPDDPAVGSPYGTGDETWGLAKEYKQYASIYGDLYLQARPRSLANNSPSPVFLYQFTDPSGIIPQAFAPGVNVRTLGIGHGTEVMYNGYLGSMTAVWNVTSPSAVELANKIHDYWISFVSTGGNPNDGVGFERTQWPEYGKNKKLLQLNGQDLREVGLYRVKEMAFINKDPLVWRH